MRAACLVAAFAGVLSQLFEEMGQELFAAAQDGPYFLWARRPKKTIIDLTDWTGNMSS